MAETTKCHFCNSEVEFASEDRDVQICNADACEYKSRSYPMGDNYVTNFLSTRGRMAEQLVKCATQALAHDNYKTIFTPVPHFKNTSLDQLRATVGEHRLTKVSDLTRHSSDGEMLEALGPVVYGFLRFIFKTNKIVLGDPTDFRLNEELQQHCQVFQMDYDQQENDRFAEVVRKVGGGKTSFLYHGSPSPNWYSILMNGLKNFSGTARMRVGAAYGPGIYLSDTCSFAMSYCHDWRNANNRSGGCLIGVFELADDKTRYRKAQAIYVVPQEERVRMRYLVSIKPGANHVQVLQNLDTLFGRDIFEKKAVAKTKFTNMKAKRLATELAKIAKSDLAATGIRLAEGITGNSDVWTVYLSGMDPKLSLAKEMQQIGCKEIRVELSFGDRYPFEPPFVRIISPRFQYRTGHITLGGSICMELLTRQGWSPTYSVETLMIHLKSLILEGDGHIDLQNHGREYTLEEARTAYVRTLHAHGWS